MPGGLDRASRGHADDGHRTGDGRVIRSALESPGATGRPAPTPLDVPWPTEVWPETDPSAEVDRNDLAVAVERLFAPVGRAGIPDSQALVIVQVGRIVLERYVDGFDASSRFHT